MKQPSLFVSGRTPGARHASYKAAVKVGARRGPKTVAYLRLLAARGPLSDHAAHAALLRQGVQIAFSSIQSIRGGLMTPGAELVQDAGTYERSPYGHEVTQWTLTKAGRAVVAEMEKAA